MPCLLQVCSRAGHTGSFLGLPKNCKWLLMTPITTERPTCLHLITLFTPGSSACFIPCPFQSLGIRGIALTFLHTSQLALLPPVCLPVFPPSLRLQCNLLPPCLSDDSFPVYRIFLLAYIHCPERWVSLCIVFSQCARIVEEAALQFGCLLKSWHM